ncbi:NACHT domain-containing NTPase [Amycolatopsis sp. cg5]|uniref:NACHT domain-containing protein n=1 Tax=Amycolatopsis sp. cg5 TaxID=3238802 RepID=UPI0035233DF7
MADPVSAALVAALGATFSALHQWAVEKGADTLTQRTRKHELGNIERLLADAEAELKTVRRVEFARLDEGDWAAAQLVVAGALDGVRGLEPGVLIDPDRLLPRLRQAGRAQLSRAGLGADGHEAYERLLEQTCRRIAKRAQTVDEIRRAATARMASEVAGLGDKLNSLAAEPRTTRRRRQDEFERNYLRYVADDHATFELFQVSVGRAPARHAYADFYSAPSIARRQRDESGTELTGAGTNGAHAIAAARRVLLLGGAGAGKTTFLRWLVHAAASDDDLWQETVPFFLSLRQFTDRALPEPEELVRVTAPALAGEKPDGWVSALLRQGRAMVVVDGVDELLLARREEVRAWLTGLLRGYPDARYVVSTRPSAVDDGWLTSSLTRFELLPLTGNGLKDLVGRWFRAARDLEPAAEQREWLADCESRLAQALAGRPDVRSLVSSPLLASLLCALYRKENMYLPQSRKDLLDKALDLLLGEWDVRRGVQVEDELAMSAKEKIILLERFAAPMVRNSELLVGHGDAEKRFARAMSGLRSQGVDPALVLRHMLERTGLLREVDGRIQFVHRTFRDFLAAGEFVKAGELGYLIDHAHDDSLNEVVFMAAAQARAREAGELLSGLLERAGTRVSRKDGQMADRLILLAAASLGYVDVIDPEQIRTEVMTAVRGLIPPIGFAEAELLAKAGPFVVDLLPGPIEVGKYAEEYGHVPGAVAARVIRTLAMVGVEEAWEKISQFSGTHRATVIDELLRAWRQNEYADEYAAKLLSNVDFGELLLEVHRWDVLLRLRHLRKLTAVQLVGNISLADQATGRYPLADIPALRHLEIKSNEVAGELGGLAGCRALRSLRITGFHSVVEDLSALASLPVEDLELHVNPGFRGGRAPRLDTLAGAPLRRLSIQHPALDSGLHAVPPDLPLTTFELGMRPDRRSLLGIGRWQRLETVSARGIPDIEEVRELAGLPFLKRLVLGDAVPVADLVRLRPLGALRIELSGVPAADAQAARDALPEAELVLRQATEDSRLG